MVKTGQELSIKKQCEILEIHRSGIYYKSRGESELNLELMDKIDEKYLLRPYFGVPRMYQYLRDELGYRINYKRVERLYRLMGLEAIGPKPNTSKPAEGHKIYPYLLKGLDIDRNNQVWATDLTYIPMKKGFMYLMAIMDLKSRYVVNWSVSNSMEAEWCAQVLQEATDRLGKPEIINTDQGSQFTSEAWVNVCEGIQISMDGKGRAIDNIFIERLWRSVKYEYVYLNPAEDGLELYNGLEEYFRFYNQERGHQSLNYQVPESIYVQAA